MFPSVAVALILADTIVGLCSGTTRTTSCGLKQSNEFEPYDPRLFPPLKDLSLLSTHEFSSIGHPAFPNYSVRVKKSNFNCDGFGASSYTGYIDIGARHLFFYFFQSRRSHKDDVIFWTNGGPGCSSSLGLFMELGPCLISTGFDYSAYNPLNPFSWTTNANMFFLDQPVGVGFSYANYGEPVSTTEETATDIAAFIAIFFEHFTDFKGIPFHIAGESYGGRYASAFAARIYDQNAKLVEAGMSPINLKSVIIGNGCSDVPSILTSLYDMQCRGSPASHAPVQGIRTCVQMKQALPHCEEQINAVCFETFSAINCQAASTFCTDVLLTPFLNTGRNPYDLTKLCHGPIEKTLCYPITKQISAYLDRPDVRKAIGVDPSITGNFSACSDDITARFHSTLLDATFPSQLYTAALLERGIKVLVYAGANDWACNWISSERMSLALEWSGQEAFAEQPLRGWMAEGTTAGVTRSSGGLTFATIYGAGHMAPGDQQRISLAMIRRWLAGKEL